MAWPDCDVTVQTFVILDSPVYGFDENFVKMHQ